jgi:hypothetical protein
MVRTLSAMLSFALILSSSSWNTAQAQTPIFDTRFLIDHSFGGDFVEKIESTLLRTGNNEGLLGFALTVGPNSQAALRGILPNSQTQRDLINEKLNKALEHKSLTGAQVVLIPQIIRHQLQNIRVSSFNNALQSVLAERGYALNEFHALIKQISPEQLDLHLERLAALKHGMPGKINPAVNYGSANNDKETLWRLQDQQEFEYEEALHQKADQATLAGTPEGAKLLLDAKNAIEKFRRGEQLNIYEALSIVHDVANGVALKLSSTELGNIDKIIRLADTKIESARVHNEDGQEEIVAKGQVDKVTFVNQLKETKNRHLSKLEQLERDQVINPTISVRNPRNLHSDLGKVQTQYTYTNMGKFYLNLAELNEAGKAVIESGVIGDKVLQALAQGQPELSDEDFLSHLTRAVRQALNMTKLASYEDAQRFEADVQKAYDKYLKERPVTKPGIFGIGAEISRHVPPEKLIEIRQAIREYYSQDIDGVPSKAALSHKLIAIFESASEYSRLDAQTLAREFADILTISVTDDEVNQAIREALAKQGKPVEQIRRDRKQIALPLLDNLNKEKVEATYQYLPDVQMQLRYSHDRIKLIFDEPVKTHISLKDIQPESSALADMVRKFALQHQKRLDEEFIATQSQLLIDLAQFAVGIESSFVAAKVREVSPSSREYLDFQKLALTVLEQGKLDDKSVQEQKTQKAYAETRENRSLRNPRKFESPDKRAKPVEPPHLTNEQIDKKIEETRKANAPKLAKAESKRRSDDQLTKEQIAAVRAAKEAEQKKHMIEFGGALGKAVDLGARIQDRLLGKSKSDAERTGDPYIEYDDPNVKRREARGRAAHVLDVYGNPAKGIPGKFDKDLKKANSFPAAVCLWFLSRLHGIPKPLNKQGVNERLYPPK